MKKEIVKELAEIVGEDNVTTENADKITHSYDATQKKYLPDAVDYARTVEEVSKVVKVANKWTIPLLTCGAGSGFTGGTLPIQGGIVLVLTKMDKILDIDVDNLVAKVEPGGSTLRKIWGDEGLHTWQKSVYPDGGVRNEICRAIQTIIANNRGTKSWRAYPFL